MQSTVFYFKLNVLRQRPWKEMCLCLLGEKLRIIIRKLHGGELFCTLASGPEGSQLKPFWIHVGVCESLLVSSQSKFLNIKLTGNLYRVYTTSSLSLHPVF